MFMRKLLAILFLAVISCCCALCFSACHTHSFVEEVASDIYFSSGATCTEPARYFYSCSCGEKGVLTFNYGERLGHDYTNYVYNNDATCVSNGTKTGTCSRENCGETNRIIQGNSALGHIYDGYTYDKDNHWQVCSVCQTETEKAEHQFNDNFICETCGREKAPTDGIIYQISSDGTYAEVVRYGGLESDVIIASVYQDKPVKMICKNAFTNRPSKIIVIPDTIETIDDYAFSNCRSLEKIIIGNGVKNIGDYAFHFCKKLTSIEIPESVISIGEHAISNCYDLQSITLNEGLESIGDNAFIGCSSLKSVVIPNSVTSIGTMAFIECSVIEVTIGSGVSYIGEDAFSSKSLENIYVDEENKEYKSIDGVLYSKDGKQLIRYPNVR